MIEFTPYQIIVPLFALIMVIYAWNLVSRQKKTIWEGLIWTAFWGAVAYAAVFPGNLQLLSEITGIKKNENAAVVTALGMTFFAIFYILIRIESLEQRVTKVIREEALEETSIRKSNH